MGNVPTKEQRTRLVLVSGSSAAPSARAGRRHTTLALIGAPPFAANSVLFGHKKSEDKHKLKEKHLLDLVVRVRDNVDGGYLAPFGIYRQNLDYNTDIVRALIVARRLAPFYTPLQDWDASWTPHEVATLVLQTPLHALDAAFEEENDDVDDHKIHRLANFFRRQELKKRHQELVERAREIQRRCEAEYTQFKASHDPAVLSEDLLVRLYGDASECPICFLYFPQNLNQSRCCGQPICTECFVQIRRLDPHPPHDAEDKDEVPQTLISQPALCPYCAMADFGVTYERPSDICVGLGGAMAPGDYKLGKLGTSGKGGSSGTPTSENGGANGSNGAKENGVSAQTGSNAHSEHTGRIVLPTNTQTQILGSALPLGDTAVVSDDEESPAETHTPTPRRRSSVPADADGVITTDYIRPDWEQKLASAKSKLARKAATASAIHASNLILNESGSTQQLQYLESLEDRMVEEAMRLLLLDEEERRRTK